MFSWPGPDAALTMQSERTGIENKWYALTGRVVELKVEEDGDLHIALHDVTGDKPGVLSVKSLQNRSGVRFAQQFLVGPHTVSFSHWHCEEADLRSISYHYSDWESVLGRRPCTERSKQPTEVHAGLCCVGNSSIDEADRPALAAERACQFAVFSDKMPLWRQKYFYLAYENNRSIHRWFTDCHCCMGTDG
jgi:hypothetical protein